MHGVVAAAVGPAIVWVLVTGVIAAQPNVLLIVADDVGIDRIAAYGAHPDPGRTPHIDQLAAEGVLFRNVYSDPLCSPTRAGILTGRYGFRTGVSDPLPWDTASYELGLGETTIPEALPAAYRSAAFGKWHLSCASESGPTHPLLQGFAHHAGTMANIDPPDTYFAFQKWVDGVPTQATTYATTDSVNDALEWIGTNPEPWFVWLAFNTAHTPIHAPPDDLHSYELPPEVHDDQPLHVQAMIEAMDTEIGRLVDRMRPEVLANTVVVFVGDNGTTPAGVSPPSDPAHAKGTCYEGGIRVPLVVKGPGVVAGAQCNALVNTTDLFATVVELAGGDAGSGVDSVSLVPYLGAPGTPTIRGYTYSGDYVPPGYYPTLKHLRAVRERRFKLMHTMQQAAGVDAYEMYDVGSDPAELDNLLDGPLTPGQQLAYDSLSSLLAVLAPPWTLLEGGVPGVHGTPRLRGYGALLGGEPMSIELVRAAFRAPALLTVGVEVLGLPLFGGELVPDLFAPGGGLVPLATDAIGKVVIEGDWPLAVPPGIELFMQYWIGDATTTFGWSASNGLQLTTP